MLEIKDIYVFYGNLEALKGVSVRVEAGSIVTLIGANGAGKSTLLKSISGLMRPRVGEIWLSGRRIDKVYPQNIVALGVGHIPEGRRLFPHMTVLDNLKLGAYLVKSRGEVKRNLDMLYVDFPVLKERSTQLAGTLSGGEQQMLAIARALMASPKLLLLDEPSLGLSPLMVQEMARIITDINRRGVTILLVEQNAAVALRLARKAYLMEVGEILLEGDPKELVSNELVKKAYLG